MGAWLTVFSCFNDIKIPFVKSQFSILDRIFRKVISFSETGSNFYSNHLYLMSDIMYMMNFAFRALPVIIFFSSLIAMSYHFGIVQTIKFIFKIMRSTMRTSVLKH